MAHHKRHRAKHQRAGCLMCKPHKDDRGANALGAQTLQEQQAVASEVAGWNGDDFAWLEPDGTVPEDFWPGAFHEQDIVAQGRQQPHGRAPRRKPFAIEALWVRGAHRSGAAVWSTYRRYATGAQRDQALARLAAMEARRPHGPLFEFRAP